MEETPNISCSDFLEKHKATNLDRITQDAFQQCINDVSYAAAKSYSTTIHKNKFIHSLSMKKQNLTAQRIGAERLISEISTIEQSKDTKILTLAKIFEKATILIEEKCMLADLRTSIKREAAQKSTEGVNLAATSILANIRKITEDTTCTAKSTVLVEARVLTSKILTEKERLIIKNRVLKAKL
jgi:hypothetical protein